MEKEDSALNYLQWLICHKTTANHLYIQYMNKQGGINSHFLKSFV